jgi:hypothetical protein
VRCLDAIDFGGIRTPELVALTASLQGNNEEFMKRLRDAIALAQKLRWRCKAFQCSSCGNVTRAENMAVRRGGCSLPARSSNDARPRRDRSAGAAIAPAQPCLQRYYENDKVEVTSTLITEVSQYSTCAAGIPTFRSATDDCLR